MYIYLIESKDYKPQMKIWWKDINDVVIGNIGNIGYIGQVETVTYVCFE